MVWRRVCLSVVLGKYGVVYKIYDDCLSHGWVAANHQMGVRVLKAEPGCNIRTVLVLLLGRCYGDLFLIIHLPRCVPKLISRLSKIIVIIIIITIILQSYVGTAVSESEVQTPFLVWFAPPLHHHLFFFFFLNLVPSTHSFIDQPESNPVPSHPSVVHSCGWSCASGATNPLAWSYCCSLGDSAPIDIDRGSMCYSHAAPRKRQNIL